MENKHIKWILENKRVIIIVTALLIALITCIIILVSKTGTFVGKIKSGKYDEAVELYNKNIKGKMKPTEETKKQVEELIESTVDDFNKDRIDLETTNQVLKTIGETKLLSSKVTETMELIEKLNASKLAYNKGVEFLKENDYYNAIISFNDVIEEDEHYDEAKKQSDTILHDYKETIMSDLENDKSANYENKIGELEKLQVIARNDKEIQAKIEIFKEKQIENLKNNQEVMVSLAKTHKEWYSSTTSGIQVIVKNNSKKVVKNYEVGMLAYDSNGYPLKIEYEGNLKLGKAEAANIQPGKTHGSDKYYSIYYEEEKMKTVIACVKEVEYYDGSKWENPYYEYWLETYNDKPYKK